ncbi:DUF4181 domain-containing protein [Planococcus sp. CPCC 101016]|uniref:DUF4181 domain-containing protein n=1 Tax=Planococcus sp. CPCC 101016 TaxID=2599617 RepID=UPI0011B46B28|nr:DUF4181 domain-containing protein [Planococcus sp. CPCC 101016]TWT06369.1 DUF4181 domain-containing protein [Planococcus sp. CPCC 101016]
MIVEALILCLGFIVVNFFVGRYIRRRWEITKRKEWLYWPLNRTHALIEAFLMISFLIGAVVLGNRLMGTINWVYYLFFFFVVVSVSRAFMEWKYAKSDNMWISQLTEASIAALLLLSFFFPL